MSVTWSDLDARARGLATRLLGRARLESLAHTKDLHALAADLERAGYERVTPIDRAVRRTIAARMRTLERWAGDRGGVLAVLFEEQDVRNLRALFRGALAGAPAEARLAATMPTALLPEGALAELARVHGPGDLAALLLLWRHPYAAAIAKEARRDAPRVFALEAQLCARFADRARGAARDRELRAFVAETIDLQNAFAAIELANHGEGKEARAARAYFVEGGARLDWPHFQAAASAEPADAARRIAACFARTDLADAFSREPAALNDAVLAARIEEQVRAARLDPLGPAPILSYVLRLRAEAADVRRLVAGIALGMPVPMLVSQLVTK